MNVLIEILVLGQQMGKEDIVGGKKNLSTL